MNGTEGRVREDERGFASMLVAMVLLLVMTLITVGFAAQMRKEQRAALDNQLSTQAYYAAESGVNDYAKVIRGYLIDHPLLSATDITNLTKTSCDPAVSGVYGGMPTATLATGVKYTCVLINPKPTSLVYGSIGSTSQIIPIHSTSALDTLTISWQPSTTVDTPTASCPPKTNINTYPPTGYWPCQVGILRVDLVPTTGTFSVEQLQANTMTAYFVPTRPSNTGSGTISYSNGSINNQYGSDANQGAVAAAKCTATSCSMKITGLTQASYYLRVSSIYDTVSLQVQGYTATDTTTPVELTDAQVLIDSTGLAQDVLHRIQVRIAVNSTAGGDTFDTALQSGQSLCKKFKTAPPSVYANAAPGC